MRRWRKEPRAVAKGREGSLTRYDTGACGTLWIAPDVPRAWHDELLAAFRIFCQQRFEGHVVLTSSGPSMQRSFGKFHLMHDAGVGDTFGTLSRGKSTAAHHDWLERSRPRTPRSGRRPR